MIFGIGLESLVDLVNVSTLLVREVALDQLEYFIQRHQRPDGLFGERRAVRHQHFIRLFDDRAVAAAVMPWGTGLKSNARHDPDAEINVMGRVWVEMNEVALADVGAAGCSFQTKSGVQLPFIPFEQVL